MKWKTKEGKVIDIKNMSTNHIKNAMSYLEKNIEKYRDGAIHSGYSALAGMQGEMAIHNIESDLNYYETATKKELLEDAGYFELEEELRSRE